MKKKENKENRRKRMKIKEGGKDGHLRESIDKSLMILH